MVGRCQKCLEQSTPAQKITVLQAPGGFPGQECSKAGVDGERTWRRRCRRSSSASSVVAGVAAAAAPEDDAADSFEAPCAASPGGTCCCFLLPLLGFAAVPLASPGAASLLWRAGDSAAAPAAATGVASASLKMSPPSFSSSFTLQQR